MESVKVGATAPKRRGLLSWGLLFFLLFVGGAVSYAVTVLVPSFRSPNSRMYATALGYPAVQRWRGEPIEVDVETVGVRQMTTFVSAEGSLAYLNEIPVKSEVPGIVTGILAEPGDVVHKGDVLLRIHTGGFGARLDELIRDEKRWEAKQAHVTLARTEELYYGKASSAAETEMARLHVRRAEASLAVAEERYRQALLSRSKAVIEGRPAETAAAAAPAEVEILCAKAGTVLERNVQPGENLIETSQGRTLMLIGDRMVFRAEFDQRYASAIQLGDKATIHLRAYTEAALAGTVVRIANEVQSSKQALSAAPGQSTAPGRGRGAGQPLYPFTFSVWLAFDGRLPASKRLIAGMNGYCAFAKRFAAPAIPEGSLMRYSGRTGTVLAVNGDRRLEVRAVTYVGAQDGWLAVDSGLKAGDRIVSRGHTALQAGDEVVVGHK